ncbi:MAG: hypothetical protein ABSF49_09320 [Roseiarcus sp.]
MEPHELAIAAKYIGAGLAAIGTGAAGIGVADLVPAAVRRLTANA